MANFPPLGVPKTPRTHSAEYSGVRSPLADFRGEYWYKYRPRNFNNAPESYPEIWPISDAEEFRGHRANFPQSIREPAAFSQTSRTNIGINIRPGARLPAQNPIRKYGKFTTPRTLPAQLSAIRRVSGHFPNGYRYRYSFANFPIRPRIIFGNFANLRIRNDP